MSEEQEILDFCIEFTKLTFHDKFKNHDGTYKSNCGKHTIDYLHNNKTISRIGHTRKVVEINSEIHNLSFTTRLFFCLWSFIIMKCGNSEERADLVTITLMKSVWKSQKLSDKDLSDDIFTFMINHPSHINEKRIKNIINYLIVQKNESIFTKPISPI